jgi:hypothetical protein
MATLDVYPNAHAESTSVDGTMAATANAVWATIRGATSCTPSPSSTTLDIEAYKNGALYYLSRVGILFDTSALDDAATVTGGDIYLYVSTSGNPADVRVVSSTPASSTDLVSADFDNIGTTQYGSYAATPGSTGYISIALDATGYGTISKTGVSKFALITGKDFDNVAPVDITGHRFYCYSADRAATTEDPYLRVTYTLPSTDTGNFLSFLM